MARPDLTYLETPLRALAGNDDYAVRRDGVGFTAYDTQFGNSLAEKPSSRWTFKQANAVYKLLKKYRNQLKEMGFDYASFKAPEPWTEDPAPASKGQRTVTLSSDKSEVIVDFSAAFSWDCVTAVKRIQGARFHEKNGKKFWIVPANIANIKKINQLKNLDFEISNTITDLEMEIKNNIEASFAMDTAQEVDIPAMKCELDPYQKVGVLFASKKKRCVIGDDKGLGKTIEAMATLENLNAYPALILCPPNADHKWKWEYDTKLPSKKVALMESNSNPMHMVDADVIIIRYTLIKKFFNDIMSLTVLNAMVCDESQNLKGYKTQRTKLTKEISKKMRQNGMNVKFHLSGGFTTKHPKDAITQLDIIDRLDDLGGFPTVWSAYCNYGSTPSVNQVQDFNAALRATCYLRRDRSQVFQDLPSTPRVAPVPLSISNMSTYLETERSLAKWYSDKLERNEEIKAALDMLPSSERQAYKDKIIAECNSSAADQLVKIEALKQVALKGKMDLIKDWISEFVEENQKLVVYFVHTNFVYDTMKKNFPKALFITGKETPAVKFENSQRFQNDPNCNLIFCAIGSSKSAIDLFSASNVAFMEFPWTPEDVDQAVSRLLRRGQKHPVTAWNLFAIDTIEEDILQMLKDRERTVTATNTGVDIENTPSDEVSMVKTLFERIVEKHKTK